MTTKERLHQLIEELPESETDTVARYLEAMRTAAGDPVMLALLTAPEDDEPLTDEDVAALREAREDYAAERTRPLADLKRDMGL